MTTHPSDLERALALVPKLEGLLEKATKGEWSHAPISRDHEVIEDRIVRREARGPATIVADDICDHRDAHWIVALHNAAPTLLSALRTVEEERKALTDPNVVHVNMLRGGIAKPSVAQIRHIYGSALEGEPLPSAPVSSLGEGK